MIIKTLKFIYAIARMEIQFLLLLLLRLLEIITQIFPATSRGCKIRGLIYKPFLKKCGKNFQVAIGAKLEHLHNIEVGEDVYIGPDCWICGIRGGIKFDDQVMLGPQICMSSSNHIIKNNSYRFGPGEGKKIHIKKGTWIASNCVIVAGVTIGECCLIAAGAVVTKDIESNSIVGGVPAEIIGKQKK